MAGPTQNSEKTTSQHSTMDRRLALKARGIMTGKEPLPTWPLKIPDGKTIDRAFLENLFAPWGEAGTHVPIHFGEMGCYNTHRQM